MSEQKLIKSSDIKIAEYSKTAAGLAGLIAKYSGVIYPVSTTAGMKSAVAARAEVKGVRVDLEKMRKEIKAPALERCRLIDDEAKLITAALVALESPIDEQIKAEEKRKEYEKATKIEAERVRVSSIQDVIKTFERAIIHCSNLSSSVIRESIETMTAYAIDYDFMEFKAEADLTRKSSLEKLELMAIEAEQREAQAIETARQLADLEAMKAAESARIANEAKQKAEREAKECAEREEFEAKVKAESDAKQAVIDAENARLTQIERDRMAAEQDEIARQQAEIKRQQDEIKRQQDEIESQRKAQEDKEREEAEAKQRHEQYLADWDLAILQYATWLDHTEYLDRIERENSEKAQAENLAFEALDIGYLESDFLSGDMTLRGALIEAYIAGQASVK